MSPESDAQVAPVFGFKGYAVHRAAMALGKRDPVGPDEQRPPQLNHQIAMTATIAMRDDHEEAIVTLKIGITGDPKWMPYFVEVDVVGVFTCTAGFPKQFDSFTKVNAPTILFPYVREMVFRLTTDGPFGAIRLDPINVASVLGQNTWKDIDEAGDEIKQEEAKS